MTRIATAAHSFPYVNGRMTVGINSFQFERSAIEVFRSLDFNENAETFLFGVAVFFGLNKTIPNLFVYRSGFMKLGDTVEAGDATLWQNAGLPQFGFPEEDSDLASVFQALAGCAFAALPQCEMLVVENHRAASRGHLCKPIRKDRRNKAYTHRK